MSYLYIAARDLIKINESFASRIYCNDPISSEELDQEQAWVLIGEGGSGKTEYFKRAANTLGSQAKYITVSDFLYEEHFELYRDKILFLDGLDEVRPKPNEDEGIVRKICQKLQKSHCKKIRISCRTSSWFGESDKAILKSLNKQQKIPVYSLLPLEDEEIIKILERNFSIESAGSFVEKCGELDISSLLKQPQTLGLLAKIGISNLPNSKKNAYELACRIIIQEDNKSYRDKNRHHPIAAETLLKMAGELFAIMLLSDKSGIALDEDRANEQFPSIDDYFHNAINNGISELLNRKIFKTSYSSEERLEPIHRSIAEYLAADWLSMQIDEGRISMDRLFNILLSSVDKKSITSLRGLYGWLATILKDKDIRLQLIKKDPLSVLIHSDLASLSKNEKYILLKTLQQQRIESLEIAHQIRCSETLLGFFEQDQDIEDIFLDVLRDKSNDHFCYSMLILLQNYPCNKKIIDQLVSIIKDVDYGDNVRIEALKLWLQQSTISNQQKLVILDAVHGGKIRDSDNRLLTILVRDLYPSVIKPNNLLNYYNPQKYYFSSFWVSDIPQKVKDAGHLPILLENLANSPIKERINDPHKSCENFGLHSMALKIIQHAIETYGNGITGEQLFEWLSIVHEKDDAFQSFLNNFLSKKTVLHKELLNMHYQFLETSKWTNYYSSNPYSDGNILFSITPISSLSSWHLEQINKLSSKEHIQLHVRDALNAMNSEQNKHELNFNQFYQAITEKQIPLAWIQPFLISSIPNPYFPHLRKQKIAEKKQKAEVFEEYVLENEKKIRSGEAVGILSSLVQIWLGEIPYTNSNTQPLKQFQNYFGENGDYIYAITQEGLQNAVKLGRSDTIDTVISLALKNKRSGAIPIFLVGANLLFKKNPALVDNLPKHTLELLICFKFLELVECKNKWWDHFLEKFPQLVAEVLLFYARKYVAANRIYTGNWIYDLLAKNNHKTLAELVIPTLLNLSPLRITSSPNEKSKTPSFSPKLRALEHLLKTALRYNLNEAVLPIIHQKLSLKSMRGIEQKIYWYVTGLLMDPKKYEEKFWEYVGNSSKKANAVSKFLSSQYEYLNVGNTLSVQTIGKLIKLLEPDATVDLLIGFELEVAENDSMRRGYHITNLIKQLVVYNNKEALDMIDSLLDIASMHRLYGLLKHARSQLIERIRENIFKFPSLQDIVAILHQQHPTSSLDLWTLSRSVVAMIADQIKVDNSNLYKYFWNEEKNKKPSTPKSEESCRDALLPMLRNLLKPYGVEPEGRHVSETRDDIRITYKDNEEIYEVCIEIKRTQNSSLWTGLKEQLIDKYVKDNGYGIYIVLWFGRSQDFHSSPKDGKKYPTEPLELEQRLTETIPETHKNCVSVKVIDVSWFNSSHKKASQKSAG